MDVAAFGPMAALVLMAPVVLVVVIERRLRRQGYDRHRTPSGLSSESADRPFDPIASASFRGGARVGITNATWPLATLTIDRDHAKIGGIMPVWVDRKQALGVSPIRSGMGLMGSGVRFRTTSGELDGVVFWTFSPQAVLNAFARFGWPTESAGV